MQHVIYKWVCVWGGGGLRAHAFMCIYKNIWRHCWIMRLLDMRHLILSMFTTFAFGQDDNVESLHLRVNTLHKFALQNAFSHLYVFQCYEWFWSCLPLWTAACLHYVSYTMLFFWHPHAENPTIQTQDSWLSHLLLLWTPHLEFTPTRP